MSARIDARVLELEAERRDLIAYLASKTRSCDWHGVADAAMDLREVDASLETLSDLAESRP